VIGDITAFHDLNSFKLLADSEKPIFLIIINNHGGGIFSLLPIAKHTKIFEDFFGTPHKLDFKNIAKTFSLNYFNPKSINDFEIEYNKAVIKNNSAVIEIFTERSKIKEKIDEINKKLTKLI